MNRDDINKMLGMGEEDLDELARPFEEGTWDSSGYGPVQFGRPTLFDKPMRPVTFKETPSVAARAASFRPWW